METAMEFGPIFRAMTRNRARFLLIVAEVALTLAIVANCMTLILKARAAMTRPSGFDEADLIQVNSTAFADDLREPNALAQATRADLETLRAIPGVKAASNTIFLPFMGGGMSFGPHATGQPNRQVPSQFYFADAALLDTLGIHILQGRNLTQAEVESNAPETDLTQAHGGVIISQALAKQLYPNGDALGKEVEHPEGQGRQTIVGIFDPFYNPFDGTMDERAAFYPIPSGSFARGTSYLVRTEPGQVNAVAGQIEAALLKANDGRNLRVRTIEEIRQRFHSRDRMLVASLDAVMILLVFVTVLGIVGITSFSVTERRRQIGTRRALGATPLDIVRYFLLENWIVTTLGIVLGLGLAYALNYGLMTWSAGSRLDGRVLVPGVAALWMLGLGAALGPALRGAKVPPAIATRNV
jgi:putative ABC transport system permease protein